MSASPDAGGAERRLAELLAEGELDPTAALAAGDDPGAMARLLALHELAELGLEALERGVPPALVEGVEIGRKVGEYRLLAEIATGGMGALYLARDETLGRVVAVKLLARPGAAPARRFQREAEIVAGLKHPNIVEIYGRGEADGVQYIAMRYVAGHDVARTWRESRAGSDPGARDLERPLRWMVDAARALHHAHEHGVVHRDVKPANLLVEDDHLSVVDFGLASSDDALELTRSGDLLGTVPYMAPEQLRGRRDEVDRRVDVYGLGVSLHELLAGAPPFTGPTSEAVARQVLRRDPPPLARHGVPRDLEAIVTRAMEKDPDARYPTARDLAEDLERFLAREPVRARHLGPLRRAGRRILRHPGIVAAVGLVLVGLVVATVAWQKARDQRRRADTARHDAAVTAAARGDYRRAGAILEELRRGGAEIDGLSAERDRFRVLAIHDDLMRIAFIPRGEERGDASVARAPETVAAMLAELDRLPVPDAMRDRLRMIEVLFLRREGRGDEASRRLDAWGAEADAAPRRLAAWRAMVDRGDEDDVDAAGRLLAALDDHPVRDDDDHYFAAIAASRLGGAEPRGLLEIERFLSAVPGDYWGRHTKGNLLRRLGRLGEAREVYSGIIGSIAGGEDAGDLRLGAAYWQRGLVTARLGRFAEARADFERSRAAIRPWALELARSFCARGEGDLPAARVALDRALAELEPSDATGPREADETAARAAILEALVRDAVQAGDLDEAEGFAKRLATVPGARRRAVVATTAVHWARLDVRRGDANPPTAAEFSALEAEIAAGSEPAPPPRDLRLLGAQVAWYAGRPEEALARLDALVREDDDEARFLRASLRFEAVLESRALLFDRRLRDDASEAERAAWEAFHRQVAVWVRSAADDFGVLEQRGLARLDELQRLDRLRFVHGVLRYWDGELETAAEILGRLAGRDALAGDPWRASLHFHLARVERDRGRPEAAARAFRRGLELEPGDARALAEAARLAAAAGDFARVGELFRQMRRERPEPDFVEREIGAPAWDPWRDDARLRAVIPR